jgi:hypothetical protein
MQRSDNYLARRFAVLMFLGTALAPPPAHAVAELTRHGNMPIGEQPFPGRIMDASFGQDSFQ